MNLQKVFLMSTFMVALVVTLSGCVKFEMDVNVNPNKSADVNVTFLINSMLAGMAGNGDGLNLEEIKAKAEQAGYSATNQIDGKMTGYKFSKHFNNINELSEETSTDPNLQDLFKDGTSSTKIFTIKKGFFKDVYNINLDMDLESIKPPADDGNEFTSSIYKTMISQMDFKFKTSVPVKTITNNASTISEDGKSLEWILLPSQKNKIQMQLQVWNINNIVLLIIGFVLLLVIVLFLLFRRRKKIIETIINDNNQSNESEDIEENNVINPLEEDTEK